MIKNQMTFPLAIDTTNLKSTGSVMHTATNAELMPYTIGYVPYSMIEKSAVLRKFTKGNALAQPDTIFGYVADFTIEATKGIPFVYTVKTTGEGSRFNEYYNGSAWVQLPIANDNSNMRLLHSFNTDYFVNQDVNFGVQLNSLTLYFRTIECVYNETGWQGTRTSVKKLPDFSASATITPTPNIALTFSTTVSSQFGTHTYTIDQTIFNNMFENGTCEIDGGTYTSGGVDYQRKLYLAIYRVGISNTSATGNSVAYGSLCMDNVRYNGYNTDTTFFELQYGTVAQNKWLLGNVSDFLITYDASNGYYISPSETGVSIFRWSVAYYYNGVLSGGYKMSDIIVTLCTLFPVYKIGGAYYVAEFDDDYVITGKLIPYTQARAWQKNINPDNNVFDYNDIPEPDPESSDDWSGDRILAPVISGIGDLNGFITMYGLTPSQIAALGNYLWAKFTDVSFWESISIVLDNTASIDPSNILNYVVSVRAYPFDLTDVSGTTSDFPLVYFGRGLVGVPVDNVLSGTVKIIHKCVDTFAGGDMDVPANYGDFRDMEPCSKILLHVPFCGSCEINPSQIVGKHLFLRYTIDFATGGMMAICFTSDSNGVMAYPVAELHGHIGASVQLTASNEMDALQSIAGIGTGIMGLMTGNQAGLLSGVMGAASSLTSNRAAPHSTGRASGFSAYFQPRTPYIEIIYDQYYKPSDYEHTHGNACQIVDKIGNLHGYTVCRNVDTTGLTCEMDERLSIKRILESGFFVD